MMKQTFVVVLLSLAISTAFLGSAVPAQAAKPCASKAEYRAVKEGWSKSRVHRKFDTPGKRTSLHQYGDLVVESRKYQGCGSKYSAVLITYNFWAGKDTRFKVGPGGKSASWAS